MTPLGAELDPETGPGIQIEFYGITPRNEPQFVQIRILHPRKPPYGINPRQKRRVLARETIV